MARPVRCEPRCAAILAKQPRTTRPNDSRRPQSSFPTQGEPKSSPRPVGASAAGSASPASELPQRSLPSVGVVEAHDVVFAEIGAGLHLDHLQRHLAWVLETVSSAKRDIGRLVFGDDKALFTARDECRTAYDDPVFGAVMVHLQRQPCPRIHDDALDLKALATIHRIVVAPRAVNLAMVRRLWTAFGANPADDLLHVLHARFVGHQ